VGTVHIQFLPEGGDAWQDSEAPVTITNRAGFYVTSRPLAGPGAYRAAWYRNGRLRRRSRAVVVPY
jgi:hypothetical protein